MRAYQSTACRLRVYADSLQAEGELTGPFLADTAARQMRSMVMEEAGFADRPGGVAYLCATPFSAGRAPAVRRQPPAIDRGSCIAVTGAPPQANWERAEPPMHYVKYAAEVRRQAS